MSISGEVQTLTEHIGDSYEARTAAIADLAQETRKTLEDFKRERAKIASDLRQSLATNRTERARRVREIRAENQRDFEARAANVSEFLSVSERARKEDFTVLAQEIRDAVAAIESHTNRTLADFRNDHGERAAALRRELVAFRRNLSQQVEVLRADFAAEQQQAHTHWEHLAQDMQTRRARKRAHEG